MKNRIKLCSLALLLLATGVACSQQDDTRRTYESLTADQHKELLTRRSLENWDAMVKKEYEKQYAFYDPVYKAHISLEEFVESRSRYMLYSNPDLREIKVRGRIADLVVAVDTEVKQLKIPGGRIINTPPKQRVMPERWLWLDGNWYREYKNSKQTFMHY